MHGYSVAVLTYNSEKTILETLNSLKVLKGLNRVQLIVSDDASTDKTMVIVHSWLAENQALFADVKLRAANVNEGVSANHTHAFELANAEFGWYLGGDDLVDNPDFLAELDQAISKQPDFALGRTRVFEYYAEQKKKVDYFDDYAFLFAYSADVQFRFLASIGYCFRSGPGFVFRISTLRSLGYFGTYNPVFEDYQLTLRFTGSGFPICYLPLTGILWRRHAAQGTANPARMAQGLKLLRKHDIKPHLSRLHVLERFIYQFKGGLYLKVLYRYRDFFKKKARQNHPEIFETEHLYD